MRESLDAFLSAVEVFVDQLGAVRLGPLMLGIALHLVNSALRTVAWRNILAAAYPGVPVRWRHVFGAYMAGTAVNAVMPARAGDPVKLFLLHQRIKGSSYPTLGASLVPDTIVDAVIATSMLLWAWQAGLLPLPDLPSLPTFGVGWIVGNPWILLLAVIGVATGVVWAGVYIRGFWRRVRQGLVILTTPGRYLRTVALFQVASWAARVGGGWAFLEAFNVPGSLEAALLVQVASSVGTSVPATPGGLGAKQALLVIVLAGEAARSSLLAFSVGMEVTVVAVNLLVGGVSLLLLQRGFRIRRPEAEGPAPADGPPGPGTVP